MPDGRQERDAAAQRVAHEVRPFEFQMLDQCRDVVRHQLRAKWSIDVGRTAMALQVDCDDLPALGERREVGSEHRGRAQAAVEQDERPARSVGLVVELDPVHVGVAAHTFRLASPFGLGVALVFLGKDGSS